MSSPPLTSALLPVPPQSQAHTLIPETSQAVVPTDPAAAAPPPSMTEIPTPLLSKYSLPITHTTLSYGSTTAPDTTIPTQPDIPILPPPLPIPLSSSTTTTTKPSLPTKSSIIRHTQQHQQQQTSITLANIINTQLTQPSLLSSPPPPPSSTTTSTALHTLQSQPLPSTALFPPQPSHSTVSTITTQSILQPTDFYITPPYKRSISSTNTNTNTSSTVTISAAAAAAAAASSPFRHTPRPFSGLVDQKKNARVAQARLGAGRRGISSISKLTSERFMRLEVFPGVSPEKVTRADGKFVIVPPGVQFFVFPIDKECLPEAEQKVWAIVLGEALQVHWGQVRACVNLETPLIYQIRVTATGKARWDPQKRGTRRKESDPMSSCLEAIFPKGDSVWIEDCIFLDVQKRLSQNGNVSSNQNNNNNNNNNNINNNNNGINNNNNGNVSNVVVKSEGADGDNDPRKVTLSSGDGNGNGNSCIKNE